MHRIDRSALVTYTAEQMFSLVEDFLAYPEFLPWCKGAEVVSEADGHVLASLKVGFEKLNLSFTTRNTMDRPVGIHLALHEGPFRNLDGRWSFLPLGGNDGEGVVGCQVSLHIEFQFASRMQDKVMAASFERICNTLIDAFVQRAQVRFG